MSMFEPGMPSFDIGNDRDFERDQQVQRLAREICTCSGDDPDAIVIPAAYVLPVTMQGHKIIGDLSRIAVPCWVTYRRQAERLINAGWRLVERKADGEAGAG